MTRNCVLGGGEEERVINWFGNKTGSDLGCLHEWKGSLSSYQLKQ